MHITCGREAHSVVIVRVHDTQAVHSQQLVPSLLKSVETKDNRSGPSSKEKHRVDKASTLSSLQSISTASPVDALCDDVGVDPAKLLTG